MFRNYLMFSIPILATPSVSLHMHAVVVALLDISFNVSTALRLRFSQFPSFSKAGILRRQKFASTRQIATTCNGTNKRLNNTVLQK